MSIGRRAGRGSGSSVGVGQSASRRDMQRLKPRKGSVVSALRRVLMVMEVRIKLAPNKSLVPGMYSRKLIIQLQDGEIGEAIVLPALIGNRRFSILNLLLEVFLVVLT
jgi:hypothetical protein